MRIPTARLDALLLQAEELLSAKLAAHQHVRELREARSALAAWRREWSSVRPAARALGKRERGTVTISLSAQSGDKVEIEFSDDGAGIQVPRVRQAAVRVGLLTAQEADKLGDREALDLVFRSGVSTAAILTDLSGRGLGLAIVREKVERLGGTLSMETRQGAGTTFRLLLPLTLATFRGVLVRVGEHLFVLPQVHVERALRLAPQVVRTVEMREVLLLDGQAVSLVSLGAALELARPGAAGQEVEECAVVLAAGASRIAFRVHEVLGEQEVLAKTLGRPLVRVRNVAGATVLGTGRVVPILNVPDLMRSAVRASGAAGRPVTAAAAPQEARGKSILVAEDSITARALLKGILEGGGYHVSTAVDGVDALAQLRSGSFDLVVSDVDMPRMSGFDLTARIRGEKRLADLPVVLVTALESREDRERGIEVGASAYIVKRSFDQSNLLEIVRRLA
ncbi:MAG: response regulator [Candidatus Latescibacterota bacterium]